ncbi:MAG: ankyrin repeat domain-containing protein, partial [Bacteroidales bacterium]|nr:ankyrin repeat domain-containing protein [Bacteroidales bacterium]
MKKFIWGMLIIVLTSVGCTETQKQQIVSILSTGQYNTEARPVQRTSAVSTVKQTGEEGDTPLITASRQGDLKTVKALL